MNQIKRNLKPLCLIVLCCLVVCPSATVSPAAPSEDTAFSTADIGLQVITSTNRNDFHQFWTSGLGADGYILTPFYQGDFQLGVRFMSFESQQSGLTDYLSTFIYFGWGMAWDLSQRFRGFAGFSVGSDQMFFELEDRPGSKHESEAGIAVTARLSASLAGRWEVTAGGSYSEIFTRNRIRLVFVSMGISRTFDLPDWLREFLK
jgi:hypothetical protein